MTTAVKKVENTSLYYTQITPPRPNKKILLYDYDSRKHLFPLVKDREVGIYSQYQNIVIKSVCHLLLSSMTTISRLQAPSFKEASFKPWKTCMRLFKSLPKANNDV